MVILLSQLMMANRLAEEQVAEKYQPLRNCQQVEDDDVHPIVIAAHLPLLIEPNDGPESRVRLFILRFQITNTISPDLL